MAKKHNKYMLFRDSRNGLMWERYNKHMPEEFSAYNDFVNMWSTATNVKEYITGKSHQPLADFLLDFLLTDDGTSEGLFYCTYKDDLVGVAYIMAPMEGDKKTNIEYLVVNPRMQGKGFGTRMIKSIKENPDFFTYSKHKGELYASVENSNEVSLKAFLKNGFTILRPAHPTTSSIVDGRFDPLANYNKYSRLYFSERAVVDEDEDELVD